jgi:hypothetical protein
VTPAQLRVLLEAWEDALDHPPKGASTEAVELERQTLLRLLLDAIVTDLTRA